jgi:hypothetical protein
MEFVVIKYATGRTVRVDGKDCGVTNDTLRVQKGHHIFDLGEPQDYQPPFVDALVQNTTPIGPLILNVFHPVAGDV